VAPTGCQFSLDSNWGGVRRNTDCQSARPAELHSAARTTEIALVSQRVTDPLGAQASGLCSPRNSREPGVTDPFTTTLREALRKD
jgi:hypothetical protein